MTSKGVAPLPTEVLGGKTVRTWRAIIWRARQQLAHHQRRWRIRGYMRDPDGHLIEGDHTTLAGNWHEFLIHS